MEAKLHRLSITVVGRGEKCTLNHKIGDEWIFTGKTPGDICWMAFSNMIPSINVMMFGGSFPWQTDPDACTVSCPNQENLTTFEIRRLN